MNRLTQFASVSALAISVLLSACSSPGVQDTRQSGVERRQDRIDSRFNARQQRWEARGEREDARSEARFNSW